MTSKNFVEFFLIELALIFSVQARADDTELKETISQQKSQIESLRADIESLKADHFSNALNRNKLRLGISAELGIINEQSTGLAIHSYPHRNWQIEAAYINSIASTNWTQQFYYLRAKWFAGDSFYIASGLSYRSEIFNRNSLQWDESRFSGNDLGVSWSIGNEWQFSSFLIGCDWIGSYKPLVQLRQNFPSNFDSDVRRKLSSIQFPRLRLGFAF